jgi:hypothetical protein
MIAQLCSITYNANRGKGPARGIDYFIPKVVEVPAHLRKKQR